MKDARRIKVEEKNHAKGKTAKCNICRLAFYPRGSFDRFCPSCKNNNKLFHFAEWLPEHGMYV